MNLQDTLQLRFSDGTALEVHPQWVEALGKKWAATYPETEWQKYIDMVVEDIEGLYQQGKVLTKFGEVPFESEGLHNPTIAQAAKESLYAFIRFHLFQLILEPLGIRVMTPAQALEEMRRGKESDVKGEA